MKHKLWKKQRSEEKKLRFQMNAESITDPVIRKLVSSDVPLESEDLSAKEYFGTSPLLDEFYRQRGNNISAYTGYVDQPVCAAVSNADGGWVRLDRLLGSDGGDQRARYGVGDADRSRICE